MPNEQPKRPEEIVDDVSYAKWILKYCTRCGPEGDGEACFRDSCFMANLIIEKTALIGAMRDAFPEIREWMDKHLADNTGDTWDGAGRS